MTYLARNWGERGDAPKKALGMRSRTLEAPKIEDSRGLDRGMNPTLWGERIYKEISFSPLVIKISVPS